MSLGSLPVASEIYQDKFGIKSSGLFSEKDGTAKRSFSSIESKIIWKARKKWGAHGETPDPIFRAVWFSPDHKIFQVTHFKKNKWKPLMLETNLSTANLNFGQWRVRIWEDGYLIDDRFFTYNREVV